MTPLWALAVVAVAYTDPRGRFELEPSPGFVFEPRYGDASFARFVLPAPPRRGVGDLELLVSVGPPDACGRGTPVRLGDRQWRRQTDARGTAYTRPERGSCLVVRAVADERTRRLGRAEVEATVATVRALQGKPSLPDKPSPAPERPASASEPSDGLVGRWLGPGGSVLVLGESGRFSLGRRQGRWRIEGASLVLETADAPPRLLFHRKEGEQLRLWGGGLPSEQVYRLDAPPAPPQAALVGSWRAGDVELELGADGRFRLGAWSGGWVVVEGRLRLERGPTEVLEYEIGGDPKRLQLSGADLDAPVDFVRAGAGG